MNLIISLLVFAVIVYLTFPMPETMTWIAIWAVTVLAILGVLEMATGISRLIWVDSAALGVCHRWVGHAMFLLTWWTLPFGLATAIERTVRRHWWFGGFVRVVAAIGSLFFCFAASVTGYMGPSHVHGLHSPTTIQRHGVFHLMVMPAMLGLSLGFWWFLLWRQRGSNASGRFTPSPTDPSNPYRPPQTSLERNP